MVLVYIMSTIGMISFAMFVVLMVQLWTGRYK